MCAKGRRGVLVLVAVVVLACALGRGALADPVPGLGGGSAPRERSAAAAQFGAWSDSGPDIPWARILSGTLLVGGIACLAIWLLKKLNGGSPLARERYLEVLETRSVGRNVQLLLVRAAGKVVLLAVGGGGVACVAEFAADELPELDSAPAGHGLEGFRYLLKRLAGAQQ